MEQNSAEQENKSSVRTSEKQECSIVRESQKTIVLSNASTSQSFDPEACLHTNECAQKVSSIPHTCLNTAVKYEENVLASYSKCAQKVSSIPHTCLNTAVKYEENILASCSKCAHTIGPNSQEFDCEKGLDKLTCELKKLENPAELFVRVFNELIQKSSTSVSTNNPCAAYLSKIVQDLKQLKTQDDFWAYLKREVSQVPSTPKTSCALSEIKSERKCDCDDFEESQMLQNDTVVLKQEIPELSQSNNLEIASTSEQPQSTSKVSQQQNDEKYQALEFKKPLPPAELLANCMYELRKGQNFHLLNSERCKAAVSTLEFKQILTSAEKGKQATLDGDLNVQETSNAHAQTECAAEKPPPNAHADRNESSGNGFAHSENKMTSNTVSQSFKTDDISSQRFTDYKKQPRSRSTETQNCSLELDKASFKDKERQNKNINEQGKRKRNRTLASEDPEVLKFFESTINYSVIPDDLMPRRKETIETYFKKPMRPAEFLASIKAERLRAYSSIRTDKRAVSGAHASSKYKPKPDYLSLIPPNKRQRHGNEQPQSRPSKMVFERCDYEAKSASEEPLNYLGLQLKKPKKPAECSGYPQDEGGSSNDVQVERKPKVLFSTSQGMMMSLGPSKNGTQGKIAVRSLKSMCSNTSVCQDQETVNYFDVELEKLMQPQETVLKSQNTEQQQAQLSRMYVHSPEHNNSLFEEQKDLRYFDVELENLMVPTTSGNALQEVEASTSKNQSVQNLALHSSTQNNTNSLGKDRPSTSKAWRANAPDEERDLNHPDWERKKMATPAELFDQVRKEWGTEKMPDPHSNLTLRFTPTTLQTGFRLPGSDDTYVNISKIYEERAATIDSSLRKIHEELGFLQRPGKVWSKNEGARINYLKNLANHLKSDLRKLDYARRSAVDEYKFYNNPRTGTDATFVTTKQMAEAQHHYKILEHLKSFYNRRT